MRYNVSEFLIPHVNTVALSGSTSSFSFLSCRFFLSGKSEIGGKIELNVKLILCSIQPKYVSKYGPAWQLTHTTYNRLYVTQQQKVHLDGWRPGLFLRMSISSKRLIYCIRKRGWLAFMRILFRRNVFRKTIFLLNLVQTSFLTTGQILRSF